MTLGKLVVEVNINSAHSNDSADMSLHTVQLLFSTTSTA
jgi:hypothetical protein